ncbi:MAG TPA: hypothetical protein VEK07_01345 [Polyangiaceae bacterium]|nr:hypothetical protein [Polyangiaceae bacterium]
MSADRLSTILSKPWRSWLVAAAIPSAALLELGAHVIQTCSVVGEADWKAAREYVAAQIRPDDLLTFAPRWADPLGRQYFGANLATIEREARADESAFPRAFEVSIHGGHDPSLVEWRRTDRRRFGGVLVTTLENPAPVRVLDDFVSMAASASRVHVSIVQGGAEVDCPFSRGAPGSGALGFGPAVAADRFACPGGNLVAPTVLADPDYYPARRCIYARPPGAGGTLRLRFLGVALGRSLRGHHALYAEAEQPAQGPPVTIAIGIEGSLVGQAVHRDGESWKEFEFDTSGYAGTHADVVVDIGAPSAERRMYCFEATSR